jgi:hypothetical protein
LVWIPKGLFGPRLATDLERFKQSRKFTIRCQLVCSKLYLDLEHGNANILLQTVTFVIVGRLVTLAWKSYTLAYITAETAVQIYCE